MIDLEYNITAFNMDKQYGEGSARRMVEMAEQGYTLDNIAAAFKMSKQLASQKLKRLLGKTYQEWRRDR